jgi:uncharacterized protein (TIGR02271 family)
VDLRIVTQPDGITKCDEMAAKTGVREEDRFTVLPLHTEEVTVGKKQVVTGRARVSIATRHHEKRVEALLARERVEIERKPIGKPLDQAPAIRQEEDTIVIPVVEEEIVVQRRLILKEEIRIRRVRETERHEERVHIRKQEATIDRHPATAEPGTEPHPSKG